MSTTRLYVFDAYGTLLDVNAAMANHRDACGPDADRLSELWRFKQLEYTWTLTLSGQYQDFWTLTERALDFCLARFQSIDKSVKSRLLDAYFRLNAFPETAAALRELKNRGLKTAILSNGTPKMLSAALEAAHIADLFDAVLSVDAIKIYKPRAEVYGMVTKHFSVAPSDVVFISSNAWDVMGASAFGFQCAWLNRAGNPAEYPDFKPWRTIASLGDLKQL